MSVVEIEGGTVTLPSYDWIPNEDQITQSAAVLLEVVGAALDQYALGEPFTRRVWTHGDVNPIQIGDGGKKRSQLIVAFTSLELGRAGAKKFTYDDGALGSYTQMVAEFHVHLWTEWPTPKGGISAAVAADPSLAAQAVLLNKVLLVAFSALRSLSLGGIRTTPPVCPIVQDHVLVGPAKPVGPSGGFAGWDVMVQLEY